MNIKEEKQMIRAIINATPSNSDIETEIAEYYIKEITFVKKVWYVITAFLTICFICILALVSASAIPSEVSWDREIDHRLPVEYLDTTKYSIK